ncbi:hypothetical protein NP233_g3795 [Leucocoprinus birnbaumii]|uniref:Uncharacterized protein n=1 Tax=Leucocoprinus birnbaumii TaxID=56174 RepID=A0AAD5VXA9_9AGAR|nr:hypothetical protein NP233_g3795 [Leucocoprinus birnbaumii]
MAYMDVRRIQALEESGIQYDRNVKLIDACYLRNFQEFYSNAPWALSTLENDRRDFFKNKRSRSQMLESKNGAEHSDRDDAKIQLQTQVIRTVDNQIIETLTAMLSTQNSVCHAKTLKVQTPVKTRFPSQTVPKSHKAFVAQQSGVEKKHERSNLARSDAKKIRVPVFVHTGTGMDPRVIQPSLPTVFRGMKCCWQRIEAQFPNIHHRISLGLINTFHRSKKHPELHLTFKIFLDEQCIGNLHVPG